MNFKRVFLPLTAFLCLGLQQAIAQDATPTDNYYCGFNTQEEFDTWTKATNCDISWEWNYSYCSLNTGFNFGGDTDAWMFSPKINIENPDNLCIRVMMRTASTEWFKFTMGAEASAQGQSIEIMDYPDGFNNRNEQYYVFKLPSGIEPGEYYFGIQAYNPWMMGSRIDIYSFELTDATLSSITGIITDEEGSPVADATVTISGATYKAISKTTDSNGSYTFPEMSAGEYSFKVEKADYVTVEETVTVERGIDTEKNVTLALVQEPRTDVSGTVVDSFGNPISEATVEISGDETHSATTGNDGSFIINDVKISDNPYSIEIKYALKKTHRAEFTLTDSPLDLGTITLETNVIAPGNIQASLLQYGTFVSWMMPMWETEMFYDNGAYYGQASVQGENAAIGVRFAQPVILNGMKWVTTTSYKRETVDVKVYALDTYGNPTDEILYEADGIATKNYDFDGNMQWTEHVFDTPIEAGNGCLAVIIGPNLYVPYDSGTEPYPYSYQYYTANDYLQDEFANITFNGNLLLRGFGYMMGIPDEDEGSPFKSKMRMLPLADNNADNDAELTYTLWRVSSEDHDAAIASGEIVAADSWTILDEQLAETNYFDRTFKQLAQDDYYYAIRANFADGQTSGIKFSPMVENNMRTNVTMQVYTDMGLGLTDGARVTLESNGQDNPTLTATVTDGVATFNNIRKGSYNLSIEKKGFESISQAIDLSSDNNYTSSYAMTFIPERVVNLNATQEGDMVTLQWNQPQHIADDFETMPDFAVNCAGTLGWEYIDADGAKTYELAEVTQPFENMGEPMAFMVFNPSKTQPDLFKYVRPHSGNKVLIDIAIDQFYAQGKHNDDYLFSPTLNFADDFIFSFYALTCYSGLVADNEQFMVGYSTADIVSTDGIEWLTDEPQEVGGQWTQFSYNIPKEARRVVLRCVSDQRFMFAIDDIFIGYETTLAQELATYEIYIDEELLGSTASRSYSISGLEEGDHLAKVVAAYTHMDGTRQYSEETELIFTVDGTSGVEMATQNDRFTYDAQARLIRTGTPSHIKIFDLQGSLVATYHNVQEASTEHLGNGIYIAKVTSATGTTTHKIAVIN